MGGAVAALDSDAQLMLRVKEGDSSSFALLLEKYRAPAVRYLYRMVQNQAIAEELAQELFMRVYRSRNSYRPEARFTTWLFRIATHLALNALRDGRQERGREPLEGESAGATAMRIADRRPSMEEWMVFQARMEEVRAAVSTLPPKQRAAVLMHKYEEMGYLEIAEALGCSESAVKSLLFRAYETLRARLAHLAGSRERL